MLQAQWTTPLCDAGQPNGIAVWSGIEHQPMPDVSARFERSGDSRSNSCWGFTADFVWLCKSFD